MFDRILVVCAGNVCRSPVAEALLKARLSGGHVESAGLGALVGAPCAPAAARLAAAEGLDVGAHRARQLTDEMLKQADLILVMSEKQRRAVGERVPVALGKTLLFGRWLPVGQREIPDPYRGDDALFARVHRRLVEAADAWAERLR
ncbi:low molecular weight phosphotyrosine protein phosphatase [Modicisalibacter tunisiensis]|uniref:low molecular weight protein-tyrosine-phosphatase n=1 Tax=Modicisalibacter tunisiensis TaxID=390637 RepID=UPI001CCDAB8B|nr:low molecular weight protein-tyrosine-phosphatase [Modicisalibacter tunisiensis]MBZ9538033.1 low molecular weight phosphotyrosine protein phosphatase [Modicisalibacter tunisiensis]